MVKRDWHQLCADNDIGIAHGLDGEQFPVLRRDKQVTVDVRCAILDNLAPESEELTTSMRQIVALAIVISVALSARPSEAEGTVSTHLRDGWDIKAITQISSTGRTQVLLQKGTQAIICTIYYSVLDNGWTGQGCDSIP